MSIAGWWHSMSQGHDAADMLIARGHTALSTASLYVLAERVGVSDPETFVETVRWNLERHEMDTYVRAHGTRWQQFRRGVWP
jgi:hypothetical protein